MNLVFTLFNVVTKVTTFDLDNYAAVAFTIFASKRNASFTEVKSLFKRTPMLFSHH
jgi:hypothetical protein